MRIARALVGGTTDFAVESDRGWISAASLGFDLRDTGAVIDASVALRAAIASGRGAPLSPSAELQCPIVRPSKVLGVGLNYLSHVHEARSEPPERPRIFAKFPNALNGPLHPIVIGADGTAELDYEAELAVVMGRRTRSVSEQRALSAIFGYAVANDVSARDWQRQDGQISRSKSVDTFCPIGPWITTADEVADPQALRIRSWVNGEARQDATTGEMIFSVARLISFLSDTMTLEPGDVILTGTPDGVGMGMDPPTFLRPGDVVACEIDGLGRLENPVAAEP